MARVLLLTVYSGSDPRPRGAYLSLLENARLDRYRVHELINDPDRADIILFAEVDTGRLCDAVLWHPYVKCYPEKCLMFSSDWRVIPFIPGIYTAIEKSWYLPNRTRAGFYLSCLLNPMVAFEPNPERDLLYCFMGDISTHPVRRRLAALEHPRGAFVDTSRESQGVMWNGTPAEKRIFWTRYADLARRSRFVLCPRGVSPSSIRLFEAMMMGRVPVILSDEWLPPEGPDWESICLRVPENDTASLFQLLQEKSDLAYEMGLRARSEWEKHFAADVVFHRVVEQSRDILKSRRLPESLDWLTIIPQMLRLRHVREYLRQVIRSLAP